MSLTFALVQVLPLISLKAGPGSIVPGKLSIPFSPGLCTACHSTLLSASNFGVRGCHTVLAGRGGLQPTAHLAEPGLTQPPEPLLAPHGLCWLKELYGPVLEKSLSTGRRCQPSRRYQIPEICSSLLAVTLPHCSSSQESPEPWRTQGHALGGADQCILPP